MGLFRMEADRCKTTLTIFFLSLERFVTGGGFRHPNPPPTTNLVASHAAACRVGPTSIRRSLFWGVRPYGISGGVTLRAPSLLDSAAKYSTEGRGPCIAA